MQAQRRPLLLHEWVRALPSLQWMQKKLAKCHATLPLVVWVKAILCARLTHLMALWPKRLIGQAFNFACSINQEVLLFMDHARKLTGNYIAKLCRPCWLSKKTSPS